MIRRKIKNVVKNYSETEILVREATSNESWGPSNSVLVKIAVLSAVDTNIIQIMPVIWKRLKDTGKKWRHVYKSLILMEFLITRGNPSVAENCRQNIHFIQSLENFQYEDNGVDFGSRIRKRAETVVQLLQDNDLLKSERNKAAITDMRFSKAIVSQGSNVPIKYGNGVSSLSQGPSTGSFGSSLNEINKDFVKPDYVVPSSLLEEDIQLQIALAESQEDANQKKKLEEIEQLTDDYKLSLAVQKNFKENEFNKDVDSESKLDTWESNKEIASCPNDPWSPVDSQKTFDFPPANNPWPTVDASNDSLWSDSFKPDHTDPWAASQPIAEDMWVENTNEEDVNPWPAVSPESFPYVDPWKENKMSTSISQSAITSEIEYNPWSNNVASTNPIPRKVINHNKNDSVTNFLANHSHLVDFNNLISSESLKSTKDQNYNPFLDRNTQPCNPFLSSKNVVNYPTQIDWASLETEENQNPQSSPTNQFKPCIVNNSKKPNSLNPFLA